MSEMKTLWRNARNSNDSSHLPSAKKTADLLSDSGASKDERNYKENGMSLPFKIPMAYVVSEAAGLCFEAKCAKKMEQLKRSYIMEESCKGMRQRSKDRTLMDMTSTCGKKIRKSNQDAADGHRQPWFQEQENNIYGIKRPRRQAKVAQPPRGRKPSSTKRRPALIASTKEIWFLNNDTTSAIVNSQVLAKKVKNTSAKGGTNTTSTASRVQKKLTKPKHYVDNVPRFTSIPKKFFNFQEICRNTSVEGVVTTKLSGKDYNEFHKRIITSGNRSRISPISDESTGPVACKLKNSIKEETKPTDSSTQKPNYPVPKTKQGFSKLDQSSCHSQFVRTYDVVQNIQVPKNIYIRKETAGEVIEDLVEVRNQDDLDVLNTLTTLKLVKNKHGPHVESAVNGYEDLQDYETYYYPSLSKPTPRWPFTVIRDSHSDEFENVNL